VRGWSYYFYWASGSGYSVHVYIQPAAAASCSCRIFWQFYFEICDDKAGEAQNGDEIIIFSVGAIFRIGAKSATLSSEWGLTSFGFDPNLNPTMRFQHL